MVSNKIHILNTDGNLYLSGSEFTALFGYSDCKYDFFIVKYT